MSGLRLYKGKGEMGKYLGVIDFVLGGLGKGFKVGILWG